jgi:hypothetical protein
MERVFQGGIRGFHKPKYPVLNVSSMRLGSKLKLLTSERDNDNISPTVFALLHTTEGAVMTLSEIDYERTAPGDPELEALLSEREPSDDTRPALFLDDEEYFPRN